MNQVIGGAYEFYARMAAHGSQEEQRGRRFVAYTDALEREGRPRIAALVAAIGPPVGGDGEAYRALSKALPDAPGYFHGKHMAERIDRALGRRRRSPHARIRPPSSSPTLTPAPLRRPVPPAQVCDLLRGVAAGADGG